MVTMVQLRDLDVAVWTASANEWHARSADLLNGARDLRDTAQAPLTGPAWNGPAGDEARRHIGELVERLKIDAIECQAISYVVHGVTQNALEGGGLQQHNDIWTGTLSEDSWSKGPQTGWGWFDEHNYTHSASWAQAQTSYDFWTDPDRGTEVDIADAQPGDIVYWEQEDDGHDIPPGTVHHAAVVTSVVDGDIRYTQHSGNQINASLDGRAPVNEFDGGRQKVHVVRPHPDW